MLFIFGIYCTKYATLMQDGSAIGSLNTVVEREALHILFYSASILLL